MPVGFLRGGLGDDDAREAVLCVLRRGPRMLTDLVQDVAERLERPNLRQGQLIPPLLRMNERGLVRFSGRGQSKLCSLTLKGHELAQAVLESEQSEDKVPVVENAQYSGRDEEDEADAGIRHYVLGLIESAAIEAPVELSEPELSDDQLDALPR